MAETTTPDHYLANQRIVAPGYSIMQDRKTEARWSFNIGSNDALKEKPQLIRQAEIDRLFDATSADQFYDLLICKYRYRQRLANKASHTPLNFP
jgi:hypothetical protein